MDRNNLIQIFYRDLNRYRNRYRYVGIFTKFSTLIILLLFGISTFLGPSKWVTIYQATSLVLYLTVSVIRPDRYKLELKKRIHDLFEIVTRLSKSQMTELEWENSVDDILEKGLLLEVQSEASIKLVDQSKTLKSMTNSQLPAGLIPTEEPIPVEI